MHKTTKITWALIVLGLIAAVSFPLLRKPLSPPHERARFCITDSSLSCDREDWVKLKEKEWGAYAPNGVSRVYKFVRRETGVLSNGSVVQSGDSVVYIPDEGEEGTLRFMHGGEWFDYSGTIRVPSQIESMYEDGAGLLAAKDAKSALAKFDSCIEQDPRFVAAYLLRAEAYRQLGQKDKAISNLDEANKLAAGCKYGDDIRKKISEISPLPRVSLP